MIFSETGTAVSAVHSGLAYKHPSVSTKLVKTWESITMAIFIRLDRTLTYTIIFLITRLCTFPSDHRMALRSEIGLKIVVLRRVEKAEFGHLVKNPDTSGLTFLRNDVAECNVVVSDTEFNLERLAFLVTECQDCPVHIIRHPRCLAAIHVIVSGHALGIHCNEFKFREIESICTKSKTRRIQEKLSVMLDLIVYLSLSFNNLYDSGPVRARNGNICLPRNGDGRAQLCSGHHYNGKYSFHSSTEPV